jgi:hypothetical protein
MRETDELRGGLAGQIDELLDEESLAVLAIMLAVSLEFSFGFAKTVSWWAGLVAGPSSLLVLSALFRWRPARARLIAGVRWIVGRR